MLLRRILRHVREQHWTAIAIDLVITVLGVFIALQVSNWNQSRLDQVRAQSYLERIHSDLAVDIRNYTGRMTFWGEVSRHGERCLNERDTNRSPTPSNWQILLSCFQASQVEEFFITSATYDELKSAGDLSLISDLRLRSALADYYTNAANPVLTERPAYRVHVRGLIPLDIQYYIWQHCYETDAAGEQQLRGCASPTSDARAAELVNQIRTDRVLMSELRYWMSNMQVAGLIGQSRNAYAMHLIASVEAHVQH